MLKNKRVSKKNPVLIRDDIRYVIYCRKSREESSDGQKQSLLDQLRSCLDYAQQKKLSLAHHNELTDEFFRDESYQRRASECKGAYEQSILERANGLFYVVEQKSAKVPDNRPLRSKLITLVKKWKIKGILSYAPDRHARNLVESGELVQLIDQNFLDVQYTNFTFENNENGRMILGINFVISYNYSDVLSKNIGRWKMGVIERGQADGKHKYGYIINESKYHEPDPEYFEVRKEAFRRKVYENQSDETIGKYIITSGFKRKFKNKNRESKLNVKWLYRIWLDPFYYGILISGNNEVDLRDWANPYYQPLITEEEHQILLDRHLQANPVSLRSYKTIDEYDEIKPFPNQFILFNGTNPMVFELPNPKRHRNALARLKVNNPETTLKDVVQPHQINYKLTGIKVNGKTFSIRWDELILRVSQCLDKHFNTNMKHFEEYREFQLNQYDSTMKKNNEKRRKFQLQINHVSSIMENYARNFNKQNKPDELQKKVYHTDIQKYQDQIDYLQQELGKLAENHRNAILELEAFILWIGEMHKNYDKAPYVRKRKITSMLFSNIIITPEKQVLIKANQWLERVLTSNNGGVREDFEQTNTMVKQIDFTVLKPIIQFWFKANKSFFDQNYNLTQQQKVLYGLDEVM